MTTQIHIRLEFVGVVDNFAITRFDNPFERQLVSLPTLFQQFLHTLTPVAPVELTQYLQPWVHLGMTSFPSSRSPFSNSEWARSIWKFILPFLPLYFNHGCSGLILLSCLQCAQQASSLNGLQHQPSSSIASDTICDSLH
jgi:hypothetical protein